MDYGKSIRISFDTDEKSVDKIKKTLSDLEKSSKINIGGIDTKTKIDFRDIIKGYEDTSNRIAEINRAIRTLSEFSTKEAKDTVKSLKQELSELEKDVKSESGKEIADKLKSGLTSVFSKAWEELKGVLSDSWEELNNMLSYSQLTSSTVREQAFQYGFSPAQNYAFSRAMDLLGISSEEDLYYMNTQQREQFITKFNEYADRYSELYDKGFFETLQDFEWEKQEFREDMEYEFIEFFMNNKDTIKGALNALMQMAKGVLSILNFLLTEGNAPRTESERRASAMDILNLSTGSTNTTVKIDNTFNGIQSSDQTGLANAGRLTYEQVILAITGGK